MVVIMDNCSIHHIDEVTDLIQQTGAIVQWLPPYSPDYNPIEEAISEAKSMMKLLRRTLTLLVYAAFPTITPDDCKGWIVDSGIYI